MRRLASVIVLGLALGAGAALAYRLAGPGRALPDPPAVVTQIREVARLETLDVRLYKKVTFAPEPREAGSLWGDVAGFLRQTFRTPQGKAIVFADAHLGLDLSRLDARSVALRGREVDVVLPPIRATIELRPDETEIIGSNLDSAETARLFALAKEAFQREVESDGALRERARASAERNIRALLVTMGFSGVHFIETLPHAPSS
jgi:Protein of unknown function (DUF4230)